LIIFNFISLIFNFIFLILKDVEVTMSTANWNEKTVLIVDDEDLMRRAIRTKLTREGYKCFEASCATEALSQLEARPFDLVILDIKMPGRSGSDLLPEIRREYPDTAVIMATAVIDARTIVQCMKDGAHDFIPKPFEFEELLLAVGNSLIKNRVESELKFHLSNLVKTVDDQGREIRKLTLDSFEAMVMALEAKDEYSAGHSRRVVKFSEATGLHLGLPAPEMDDLHWGALLHDIGKIAVDPNILNKEDQLTREEYGHIMIHSQIGPSIVEQVANKNIQDIILHHHDRYDGANCGQETDAAHVPLGARIVAVADTYDAMTSNRPFRSALSGEQACAEIEKKSGTQFHPQVASAFLYVCHNDSKFGGSMMR
jgi:response regulator RpfG family c-di-GMP phosphodiesterase